MSFSCNNRQLFNHLVIDQRVSSASASQSARICQPLHHLSSFSMKILRGGRVSTAAEGVDLMVPVMQMQAVAASGQSSE
jgi:hypothetical protein